MSLDSTVEPETPCLLPPEGCVTRWDPYATVPEQKQVEERKVHRKPISSLTWSEDGKQLLTVDDGGKVKRASDFYRTKYLGSCRTSGSRLQFKF